MRGCCAPSPHYRDESSAAWRPRTAAARGSDQVRVWAWELVFPCAVGPVLRMAPHPHALLAPGYWASIATTSPAAHAYRCVGIARRGQQTTVYFPLAAP